MERLNDFENLLRTTLLPSSVPSFEQMWTPVELSLIKQPARAHFLHFRARGVKASLAFIGLLVMMTSIVFATSPDIRQQLKTAVGIGGQGNHLTSLQPSPSFTIFQPTYLPAGMQLITTAYNPGVAGGSQSLPSISGSAARVDGKGIDPSVIATATSRSSQLLTSSHEAVVVLIYASGVDRFVDVVQRPAMGLSLPTGDPVTVHGTRATLMQSDGRDILTWVEHGTFIQVATTLGREEALRMANDFMPSTLATIEAQPNNGTAPAWLTTSLAQRTGIIQTPTADQQAIRQQCGQWRALPSNISADSYQQAICVARIIAGEDHQVNAGVDYYDWHRAAARLGLDPSVGPSGNPNVYLIQINISNDGGTAVVLDAKTGIPYIVERLRPVP